MKKLWELVKAMLKIGCIGFGGGSALIPVIENEVVDNKKLVTKNDFDRNVIVACITPGALPVEIASGVGKIICGKKGMILSACAMAAPGALLTLFLLVIFSYINEEIIKQMGFLAAGVSIFIIYLLLHYISGVLKKAKNDNIVVHMLIVIIVVFMLNGGKEIRMITGIGGTPFFDLSSIQIMGLALFLIFFLSGNMSRWSMPTAIILSLLYIFGAGKHAFITNSYVIDGTKAIMFILGLCNFLRMMRKDCSVSLIGKRAAVIDLLVWSIFLLLLLLPAILTCSQAIKFTGKGMLSSVISFGGGDAFISVADGMFVNSQMISENLFYKEIVTLVNALPGSILCKTLTGIGYVIGLESTNHVVGGLFMAIAGFGISVFGSCSLSITVLHFFETLQDVTIFKNLSRWIRPIVGGMLINIMIVLYCNVLKTGSQSNISNIWMFLNSLFIFVGVIMARRKKISSGWIILGTVILSSILCNVGI